MSFAGSAGRTVLSNARAPSQGYGTQRQRPQFLNISQKPAFDCLGSLVDRLRPWLRALAFGQFAISGDGYEAPLRIVCNIGRFMRPVGTFGSVMFPVGHVG